jgi:hypothetical protein
MDTHVNHAPTPAIFEEHFTVPQLATRWNMSRTTVWRWFMSEPGVVQLSKRPDGKRVSRKRERIGLRIPASVAERVYRKHLLR